MQDLTITLIQSELHWENPVANRAMFEEKLWKIKGITDLIILPEMFTTGFTMNAPLLSEPMNLSTFKWMKQMASQTGAVVTGSFIVKEEGNFYNRLLWMNPNGTYTSYDKRHLFRMAKEDQVYVGGNKRIIQQVKGWNVCPLVCYDLRFPVWSRNVKNEYDLLLYVANWPEARRIPWQVLLQARAIENLCYTAGVNRVGTDGNAISYSGDSSVFNFRGDTLFSISHTQQIHSVTLSMQALQDFRQKFPAFLDADQFTIQ